MSQASARSISGSEGQPSLPQALCDPLDVRLILEGHSADALGERIARIYCHQLAPDPSGFFDLSASFNDEERPLVDLLGQSIQALRFVALNDFLQRFQRVGHGMVPQGLSIGRQTIDGAPALRLPHSRADH